MTSISTVSWPVKYGLRYTASWPGTPWPKLHRLCWVIILSVLQTYQYNYVIIHYKFDSLIEIIDNISACIPFTLAYIKLIVVWSHNGIFRDILKIMEKESQQYAMLDKGDLILKTVYLTHRVTNTVLCVTVTATVLYVIAFLVSQNENVTERRHLLLKMELPFDTNESPNYELAIVMQYVYQLSTAYAFSIYTAVLLMIVLHVGCQVDIMCRALLDDTTEKERKVKVFIRRHQEIILLTRLIEKVFTFITLSQLLTNTILICCLGYLIVTALEADNGYVMLLKCILFYTTICLEIFIYCFVGEYLKTKSKLVGDTAYQFPWYDLHRSDNQRLILVILRSQRGFPFTFGKFVNVSLESFTSIMKASASYMSVLFAMS